MACFCDYFSLCHHSDNNNHNNNIVKKKDKHILEITHLVFMGTSYDVKEKVYVALVDNSETLE